ncbi:hypothetical protein JCM3770_006108 [Rhodotorula araucariae]
MGNPYEAPFPFTLPASVPMARQHHAVPGGARAPLAYNAPVRRLPSQQAQAQQQQQQQQRDEAHALRERRAPAPTAMQGGRRASTITRAATLAQPARAEQGPRQHAVDMRQGTPAAPPFVASAAWSPPPPSKPRDIADANADPIVSRTLWEDERTVVMQVLVDGHVVARRADNDWINSTKLLNMVTGMTRGKRDMYLKNEPERLVFRRGALHLKGVWLPLSAAERLARTYGLYDRLYPLFEDTIKSFLFTPVNQERTTQLVRAARGRAALVVKPDASSGLSERQREELRVRGEALEAMLTELEDGLGLLHEGTNFDAATAAAAAAADEDMFSERDVADSPASWSEDRYDGYAFQPQSPARTAGPARSGEEPASLAASYRTRFSYPAYGAQPGTAALEVQPSTSYLRERAPPTVGASLSSFSLGAYPGGKYLPAAAADTAHVPPIDISQDFGQPHLPPGAMSRRASGSCERAGDLDAVEEDRETLLWGASDALARSRPPAAAAGVLGRLSSDAAFGAAVDAVSMAPAWRDRFGRSLSLPPTHRFPTYPLDAPFGASSLAMPQAVAPMHADPVVGSDAEARDFDTLVAQLQASLRTPPWEDALAPSPLSRFSATRMSVDSAADLVYPHFGLGGRDSLVAPRAGGSELYASAEAHDRAFLCELAATHESPVGVTLDPATATAISPAAETFAHGSLDPVAMPAEDVSAAYAFPPARVTAAGGAASASETPFALDELDDSTRYAYPAAPVAEAEGVSAVDAHAAVPVAGLNAADMVSEPAMGTGALKRAFGDLAREPDPAPRCTSRRGSLGDAVFAGDQVGVRLHRLR